MGRVGALAALGIGFVGFGFFYRIFTDVVNTKIAKYILSNEYYNMSSWFWDILPWVVVIIGVICLIGAGASSRNSGGGVVVVE